MHPSKRSFLLTSAKLAALGTTELVLPRAARAAEPLPPSPAMDLGPFYPMEKPLETDADLTRARGRKQRALGEIIEVSGRVLTTDGTPQAYARLEIWQANAAGRYAHPNDRRVSAPLDPSFQGYANLRADAHGNYRFLTVKPGFYPAGSFQRSAHIHLDVRGRQQRVVTQLYFPADEAMLAQDKVLQHDLWGKPLPGQIFAQLRPETSKLEPGAPHYRFDVVLYGP